MINETELILMRIERESKRKSQNLSVSAKISMKDLSNPDDVNDYLDDTGTIWGMDLEKVTFSLQEVRLLELEKAKSRPLTLFSIDRGMIGQTKSLGPILLDNDLSVIDGMHRLADTVEIKAPIKILRVHLLRMCGII